MDRDSRVMSMGDVYVSRAAHIVCIVLQYTSVKRFYANRNMPFSPFGTDAHRTFIFSQAVMLSVSAPSFSLCPILPVFNPPLYLSLSPDPSYSLSVCGEPHSVFVFHIYYMYKSTRMAIGIRDAPSR